MGGMVAKFWIFSDLHIDVHPYEVPSPAPDCDAIIVAGDVCSRLTKRVLPWLGTHLGHLDRPVVYVPGNHDFYGTNISDELGKARKIAAEHRITLLAEGEAAVVAGVRVVGATLWTDYALSGDRCQAMLEAEPRMNDHRRIRSGLDYRRWRPQYAAAAHARQRQAIENLLMQPIDGPTIVVTHHGPHALTLQKGHVTNLFC